MLEGFHYLPYNEPKAFAELQDEKDIAAVMLEPIQGEGGVIPASREFLQSVQDFCRDKQALLIIDEVQTGIGRTGKAFGYEHEGLSPDIVTVAKGLGSGFPVGAVIGKKSSQKRFRRAPTARHSEGTCLRWLRQMPRWRPFLTEAFLKK